MKKKINLLSLVILVSVNVLTPFSYAQFDEPVEIQSTGLQITLSGEKILPLNGNGGESFTFRDMTVTDGNTTFTIMDRNLGATTNDITSTGSYGYYYQWGNNYGFPSDPNAIINTSSSIVDASNYGPNTNNGYYESGTWIMRDDWSYPGNKNLRGGSGDGFGIRRLGTDEDRQGPCPDGYYIPSHAELWAIYEVWCKSSIDCSYDENGWHGGYGLNGEDFRQFFKIPFAGSRYNNYVYQGSNADYRSSSSNEYNQSLYFYFNSSYIEARYSWAGNGKSIRCVKNSSIQPQNFTVNFNNNGIEGHNNTDSIQGTIGWYNAYISLPGLWNDEYTFLGWSTSPSGGEIYDNNYYTLSQAGITTLYAQREKRKEVKYDVNGGMWDYDDKIITELFDKGNKVREPNNPYKAGAIFMGWFTVDGERWNFEEDTVEDDMTLYAQYKEILKDGYIELSDGENTVYIKDRNQGAESTTEIYQVIDDIESLAYEMCTLDSVDGGCLEDLSVSCGMMLVPNYNQCSAEFYSMASILAGKSFKNGDEVVDYMNNGERYPYGNYYFRGNNEGASFDELEIYYNNYPPRVSISPIAYNRGFKGGYLMDEEESGWTEGNENPCDESQGEYLPTVSDWAKAMEIWANIKGYNYQINDDEEARQGHIYLYNNYRSNVEYEFRNDIMIPDDAGYIYDEDLSYTLRSLSTADDLGILSNYDLLNHDIRYESRVGLWTMLDDDDVLGIFGQDLFYKNVDNRKGGKEEYNSFNTQAMPVRCFINPEYIAELGELTSYTVTFKDGDETLFTKEVKEGKKLPRISEPKKENYAFVGWYTDSKLKNEFNFSTPIIKDITLYAKWAPKGIFHKDGYIKVSDGRNTIYVSDKNVGATVSQGLPRRLAIEIKGDELFEKYGKSKEFENAMLDYARRKGIDFYLSDDLFLYLNSDNPLKWEINEYYGNKMLGLFYAYIEEEDLTEDEQQDLLKGMNKLYKSEFSTLDECYEHFVSLGMDVDGDAFELYVINSVTNKSFTDLSDAYDYINNYNQYNPEYGEVDVNSFGNYYYWGNDNGVKYTDFEFEIEIDPETGDSYYTNIIANMSELEARGFDEGKLGAVGEGWIEGNSNPCNGKNEYLPTPDDWENLLNLYANLKGYRVEDKGNEYMSDLVMLDENGNVIEPKLFEMTPIAYNIFIEDMLIPDAGDVSSEEYIRSNSLWTAQDHLGNIGFYDRGHFYRGSASLAEDMMDGNTFAMPVRCFLNITESEDEEETPAPTPTPSYGGGGGGGRTGVTKTDDDKTHGSATEEEKKDTEVKQEDKTEKENTQKEETQEAQLPWQNVVDTTTQNNTHGSATTTSTTPTASYTQEFKNAYSFAKANGITTKSTIQDAKMYTELTRIQMAKMLSQYAINVLGQTPDYSKGVVKFNDVSNKLNSEYDDAVTLAYQLGIMGVNMKNNNFRPRDTVTRAEFATALSRMLYGLEDGRGKTKYYEPHIAKLYNEGIISNTNAKMVEKRGYVMTMLMRTVKSL